jgi:hypothetical protein
MVVEVLPHQAYVRHNNRLILLADWISPACPLLQLSDPDTPVSMRGRGGKPVMLSIVEIHEKAIVENPLKIGTSLVQILHCQLSQNGAYSRDVLSAHTIWFDPDQMLWFLGKFNPLSGSRTLATRPKRQPQYSLDW